MKLHIELTEAEKQEYDLLYFQFQEAVEKNKPFQLDFDDSLTIYELLSAIRYAAVIE